MVRSVIKFLDRNFLFIEKVQAFLDLMSSRALARDKIKSKKAEPSRIEIQRKFKSKNFVARHAKILALGNFMQFVLFQWPFLDQISVETKQKSKYKVDINSIFISIEKKYFGNILNFF